jgi:hypothetical protein
MVCGAVFELVKVLEATAKGAAVPRGGATCADADAQARKRAANPTLANRARPYRRVRA